MPLTNVIIKRLEPVDCNGVELTAGSLVRLYLDTAAVPSLPEEIRGVIQTPVTNIRMLGDAPRCVQIGREYIIRYETDDLLGAVASLTPDLVIDLGCVSCCEVLDERLAAEIAARSPLFLTAPPSDGSAALTTAFAGANNDFQLNWNPTAGVLPSLTVVNTATGSPSVGSVTYNPSTREILVFPGTDGTNINETASSLLPKIQAAVLAGGGPNHGFTITLAAGNSGAGVVAALPNTPFVVTPGTVALAIGQLARVTTTNPSGTFVDWWSCRQVSPVTLWSPPDNLIVKRSTGVLMRPFIDVDNTYTWELAYP